MKYDFVALYSILDRVWIVNVVNLKHNILTFSLYKAYLKENSNIFFIGLLIKTFEVIVTSVLFIFW